MIASIGLLVFMEDGFRLAFGEQGLTFAHNPYVTQLHEFVGLTVNTVQIAVIAASSLCLTLLGLFTTRTRIGIGWRATVSDPRMADELRRRCDQGSLSQFRHRLGTRRRSPGRLSPC